MCQDWEHHKPPPKGRDTLLSTAQQRVRPHVLPQRGSACQDLPGSGAHRLCAVTPAHGSASFPELHKNESVLLQCASVFSKLLVHLCLAQLTGHLLNKAQARKRHKKANTHRAGPLTSCCTQGTKAASKAKGMAGCRELQQGSLKASGVAPSTGESPSPLPHTSPCPLKNSQAHIQ